MKILKFLIVIVVVALSLGVAYQKNQDVVVKKKRLEQEVYNKLLAEENLKKANLKVKALQTSLSRVESKVKSTNKLLDQTIKLNDDLKVRLDRASIVQKKLEEKISEMEKISIPKEVTTATSQN